MKTPCKGLSPRSHRPCIKVCSPAPWGRLGMSGRWRAFKGTQNANTRHREQGHQRAVTLGEIVSRSQAPASTRSFFTVAAGDPDSGLHAWTTPTRPAVSPAPLLVLFTDFSLVTVLCSPGLFLCPHLRCWSYKCVTVLFMQHKGLDPGSWAH